LWTEFIFSSGSGGDDDLNISPNTAISPEVHLEVWGSGIYEKN